MSAKNPSPTNTVLEKGFSLNKDEFVEFVHTMHLQNASGRESPEEMFRLGISAAFDELARLKSPKPAKRTLSLEDIHRAFEYVGTVENRKVPRAYLLLARKKKIMPFTKGMNEEYFDEKLDVPLNFVIRDGEWRLEI